MKKLKPKKGFRYVRINPKLVIEVGPDKTDKEAVEEYNQKLKDTKPNASYRWKHNHE